MRILIVDDEALNRTLLLHILQEQGYDQCAEAESGEQALSLAEEFHPDLVLLDVMMPGLDGYQVAPELKRMAGDTYLPIIFITAMDDQESLARCLAVGGDDFASKPFNKEILLAKISAHARTRVLSKTANRQNRELLYYRNSVEREHAIIEHIFSNALGINQEVESYLDFRLAPASNFNGDLFLAEPSPSGGIYLLLGDFTGHGLASAIGALPVSKAFQAMACKGLSVAEMARTINETLLTLLPGDMFFAAAVIEITHEGTYLNVWSGSMPPLLIVSKSGRIRKRIEPAHMALGILDDDEFEDDIEHVEMQYGDRLVGYSDGVIEQVNEAQKMLGSDGLEAYLQAEPQISIEDLSQKIEIFKGAAEQLDDFTLISYTSQPLDELAVRRMRPEVPFVVNICLQGAQLSNADPVNMLISMLGSQPGFQGIRSDLFTVISELFNNALDHGVLKLDSNLKQTTEGFFEYFTERENRLQNITEGQVSIRACYFPEVHKLKVSVQDSGDGFNVEKVLPAEDESPYGRGVQLIRDLCDEFDYSDGGRCGTATFNL